MTLLALCALQGLLISAGHTDSLRVFSPEGRLLRTIQDATVLPARIDDCSDRLGLVRLQLSDGSRIWVDPIDLRLGSRR